MSGFESWAFSPGMAAGCFAAAASIICEHMRMPRGRSFQVSAAVMWGAYIIAGGRTF
jgi:hypothetical protein